MSRLRVVRPLAEPSGLNRDLRYFGAGYQRRIEDEQLEAELTRRPWRRSALRTLLAWLLTALVFSCGGSATLPTDPDCSPGSLGVELVTAPADREFPSCVEVPAHEERGATSRAWCCWKGTVSR